MKFKAKLSPKQFFSFNGSKYNAVDGFFTTEDEELIKVLSKNTNWISEKNTKPKEIEKEKIIVKNKKNNN